ncbi:MAG: MFS transporter [Acetobacteraceae bacterium]|nr:MFS transporter [Acetobacteraceae bacterium]
MFLSTLDTGIITVALPTLHSELHATAATVAWTVTGYVLALSATVVFFGRWADRIGRVRVATLGFLTFAAASVVSALAPTIGVLIAGRACQGVGAAMLQATAQALVTTQIPEQHRGRALGTLGMLIGLGPVAGPTVGGTLLSFAGWPSIFWINLPLCALAVIALRRLPQPAPGPATATSYDLAGGSLLAAAAAALLVTINLAPQHHPASAAVLIPLAATVAAGAALIARERRASDPILAPEWLTIGTTRAALLAAGAFGATSALVFVVPPFVLEHQLGLTVWQVGLIGALAPAGLVIASRASGARLASQNARTLMTSGLTLMLTALALLAATAQLHNLPTVAVLLFTYGVGGGLFQPANIAAVMTAATHARQGTIGAAQRLTLNLGIGIGTATAAAALTALPGGGAAWTAAAVISAASLTAVLIARPTQPHRTQPPT